MSKERKKERKKEDYSLIFNRCFLRKKRIKDIQRLENQIIKKDKKMVTMEER